MEITCPECSKQFNVNNNQIPDKGRLLQCGNCKNKWFFKKNLKLNENNIEINESITEINESKEPDDININEKLSDKINVKSEKLTTNTKNDLNKFKFFIFILILILAFIILIDTFKIQISYIYPDINSIMNSLYETLKDLKLFFLDLIR